MAERKGSTRSNPPQVRSSGSRGVRDIIESEGICGIQRIHSFEKGVEMSDEQQDGYEQRKRERKERERKQQAEYEQRKRERQEQEQKEQAEREQRKKERRELEGKEEEARDQRRQEQQEEERKKRQEERENED